MLQCDWKSEFHNDFRWKYSTPNVNIYWKLMLKIKCILVQALRLCTGSTAHRRSRGIALPIYDHGTRRGWGVSVTPWPFFTLGKDPVPIIREVGWAPGPVWTGGENLASTGIRSPDRPASSQSLYRLRESLWDIQKGLLVIWCNLGAVVDQCISKLELLNKFYLSVMLNRE